MAAQGNLRWMVSELVTMTKKNVASKQTAMLTQLPEQRPQTDHPNLDAPVVYTLF
jgi:hypothetical protein